MQLKDLKATSPALARRCARALPQLCTATSTSEDLEVVVRHHGILKGYPKLWWPYVELPCHGVDTASERGLSAVQAAAIERCVLSEGLSFLEDDREAASWGSVESTAIRINSSRYSGPVQADVVLQCSRLFAIIFSQFRRLTGCSWRSRHLAEASQPGSCLVCASWWLCWVAASAGRFFGQSFRAANGRSGRRNGIDGIEGIGCA
eukprot:s462_g21.t1